MQVDDDQFHTVHGVGRNLNVTILSLLKHSSGVVMASPEDVRAIASFRIVKAEIFFTGFDREGMLMDELEKICLRQQVKVVFVRPAAGIPNGLPLSTARSLQLMALADKHHFVIIEMYNEHEFWPGPAPMTFWETYNKGRVIYLGPVSRMTYPLNSIGIVIGPADFMVTVRSVAKDFSVPDRVSERLLANMVRQGTFSLLQDKMLRQYQDRSSAVDIILRNSLSGLATYTMPTAGFVVWVELNEEFDPGPDLEELEELGLYRPDALIGFYAGKPVKALMVCFGSTAMEKMKSGIKLIAESIKNGSLKMVPAFLVALAAA
jgi:GntR family transcriptional regulator/MocR family aminotransferase